VEIAGRGGGDRGRLIMVARIVPDCSGWNHLLPCALRQICRGESNTMSSVDRSRLHRRMAAECLSLAKEACDAGMRASLVEMAQRWLDLAERSEHDGWNEALRLRALGAALGQELRTMYEPPQRLPHRLLTLLMQLNAQKETD